MVNNSTKYIAMHCTQSIVTKRRIRSIWIRRPGTVSRAVRAITAVTYSKSEGNRDNTINTQISLPATKALQQTSSGAIEMQENFTGLVLTCIVSIASYMVSGICDYVLLDVLTLTSSPFFVGAHQRYICSLIVFPNSKLASL